MSPAVLDFSREKNHKAINYKKIENKKNFPSNFLKHIPLEDYAFIDQFYFIYFFNGCL